MRIVFMGTPEFAVPSLAALVDAGEEVAAVVTQPDRPAGRDLRLTPPPVKVWAEAKGLRVLQPATLKDAAAREAIFGLKPDLLVVAAYGHILPSVLLETPPHGAINVHASLLPKYRGAAPIHWAVMLGEKETGISIIRLVRELDAGDILLQSHEPVWPDDTAGSLHDRLMRRGARCLLEAIGLLKSGRTAWTRQDPGRATYAPLLSRDQARLDWTRPARACHDFIRGLNPWPVAHSYFRGQPCKIWRSAPPRGEPGPGYAVQAGRVTATASALRVQCGDSGWLDLLELQLPGRRVISGAEFAHGFHIQEGDRFE